MPSSNGIVFEDANEPLRQLRNRPPVFEGLPGRRPRDVQRPAARANSGPCRTGSGGSGSLVAPFLLLGAFGLRLGGVGLRAVLGSLRLVLGLLFLVLAFLAHVVTTAQAARSFLEPALGVVEPCHEYLPCIDPINDVALPHDDRDNVVARRACA